MNQNSDIQFSVLGSGSRGNASFIQTPKVSLLVDAGLSGKQILKRLESFGVTSVDSVIVTHEHSDHTAGISSLTRKNPDMVVYLNEQTMQSIAPKLPHFKNWHLFNTGDSFAVGDIEMTTFPVPHDAYDPLGITLRCGEHRFGFLTDLGYVTQEVFDNISSCTVLVLEANYDLELLRADTKRPWAVKQRIQARHGHLSNQDASNLLEKLIPRNTLQHIFLAHLSGDCNTPQLARDAIAQKLDQMNASHIQIHDTFQDNPTEVLKLSL